MSHGREESVLLDAQLPFSVFQSRTLSPANGPKFTIGTGPFVSISIMNIIPFTAVRAPGLEETSLGLAWLPVSVW